MSRVTVIPAKLDRATFMPLNQSVKRRVAGYNCGTYVCERAGLEP